MKVHNEFKQGDDNWFSFKVGKFSASKVADIMKVRKDGKPSTMRANMITRLALERLTGKRDDTWKGYAMERGIETEPEARSAYSFTNGVAVDEVGCISHSIWPVAICSPDGLVGDDGLLEIKCPDTMPRHYSALNGERKNVKEYHWQIQHQLFVTGRKWLDLISYDPRFPYGLQMATARVEPDTESQERLKAEINTANEEVERQLQRLKDLALAAV